MECRLKRPAAFRYPSWGWTGQGWLIYYRNPWQTSFLELQGRFGWGGNFLSAAHSLGRCVAGESLLPGLSLSGKDVRQSIKESLQLVVAREATEGRAARLGGGAVGGVGRGRARTTGRGSTRWGCVLVKGTGVRRTLDGAFNLTPGVITLPWHFR